VARLLEQLAIARASADYSATLERIALAALLPASLRARLNRVAASLTKHRLVRHVTGSSSRRNSLPSNVPCRSPPAQHTSRLDQDEHRKIYRSRGESEHRFVALSTSTVTSFASSS
jgi:hypothetical protein